MTLLRIGTLIVDDVHFPAPTSYTVKRADIQSADTGRNDSGYMTMGMVRSGVATIDVGWTNLTTYEKDALLSAISPAKILVYYLWDDDNSLSTASMYKGDRTLEMTTVAGGQARWNVSFTLIEY